MTLLAVQWHRAGLLVAEQTAWYEKQSPTFSDCMRLTRQQIWRSRITGTSRPLADVLQLPQTLLETVIHGLSSVA